MSKHAALDTFGRSGNPVIRSSAFNSSASMGSEKMTLDGAVNKTAISMCILLLTAYYTYSNAIMDYIMIGFIGGFIVALITIFKKQWSPIQHSYLIKKV